MKIPKSAQKFMDAENADDKKRWARKVREIGKKRLNNIEFIHDMVVDDIQALFHHPEKQYRHIQVTVEIILPNGFKYGRTISAVDMPKRFQRKIDADISAAVKKRMKKLVTP